jgi:hypothetical protein
LHLSLIPLSIVGLGTRLTMRIAELFIYLLAGSSTFAFGLLNTPNTPIQKPFASQAVVFQPSEQRPWDAPPPDDSYDNQIFFRLATLLQHWPNTRYPSGESLCLKATISSLPSVISMHRIVHSSRDHSRWHYSVPWSE